MAGAPAFQFYARDWFSSTRALGVYGRGIYIDLLALEWDNGPLPDNPEEIASMVGADLAELQRVWPRLREKFQSNGPGTMVNRRLEEVRAKQKAAHDAHVAGGKSTAKRRFGPKLVKQPS